TRSKRDWSSDVCSSDLIADVGRKATQLTKPGSRENQLANYVLGLGLLLQIQNYDQQAVAAKTCDGVKALETFVNEAKTALTTGRSEERRVGKEGRRARA